MSSYYLGGRIFYLLICCSMILGGALCIVLQQSEQACNELTTRGTTIFKSLSNYLHLLIKGSTTHQDTFTFDLIWSRKSPY